MEEEKVIGSILLDNDSIKAVLNVLKPKHFENKICGMLFGICQELYVTKNPIDLPIIMDKVLEEYKEYAFTKLKECTASCTTSVTIKNHAMIIIDRYKKRKFNEVVNKKTWSIEDADKLITEINDINNDKATNSKSLKDIYSSNRHKMFNKDYKPNKLEIGFFDIDKMIDGIEPGDICVIGARPAVGKSALVSQIALTLSRYGKKVMYYSLEMLQFQIYQRMICYESGIQFGRIKNATEFLNVQEETRFKKAAERLDKMNIIINDEGGKTVDDIRTECSCIKNLDCIIIDYLQLLKPSKSYKGNRAAEVGDISKNLKELATNIKVPIILLSQLNRVSTGSKEPTMAELRESGDIEQDASVIMLLWNASEEDNTLKGLKVDKARNGTTGKKMLEFNGSMMTFKESNKEFPKTQIYGNKKEKEEEEEEFPDI